MSARTYFIFSVLLLMIVGRAYAADPSTNNQLIQGSWYCPPDHDVYHRFDFNPNGTFMWLSYLPSEQNQHIWIPSFTAPQQFTFRSSNKIDVGNNGAIIIETLSSDKFRFRWTSYGVESSYACTRTRPPGDTDDSRIKGTTLTDNQKKPFIGKWKSAGGKEYVEFLSGDMCIKGILEAGRWKTTKYKFAVYHDGEDAMCGDSGMFSRKAPDKLVLDYGMGGMPIIIYHRADSSKK